MHDFVDMLQVCCEAVQFEHALPELPHVASVSLSAGDAGARVAAARTVVRATGGRRLTTRGDDGEDEAERGSEREGLQFHGRDSR
jgi:hypothetical protein